MKKLLFLNALLLAVFSAVFVSACSQPSAKPVEPAAAPETKEAAPPTAQSVATESQEALQPTPVQVAQAVPDDSAWAFEGAPPAPPGYASYEETTQAVLAGKVKMIDATNVPVPAGVVEQKDIEYGRVGDRALLLDLYSPENLSKPVPGLIFIHGGGWSGGNKEDYKYYTVRFAQRGYVVATIDYRLSGEAKFPAAVQDVKCAVRWMRANAGQYHVNPYRIAAIGGSAGGHLSMMIGYSSDVPEFEGDGGNPGVSSRVQAVVNLYGPCDLAAPVGQKAPEVTSFLGTTYDQSPELFTKASPMAYLTDDDPPTLIFHGTIDELVPIDQSDMLAKKLAQLAVPCVYDRVEGWIHTMDLAESINERCQYIMNKFFAKYLPIE